MSNKCYIAPGNSYQWLSWSLCHGMHSLHASLPPAYLSSVESTLGTTAEPIQIQNFMAYFLTKSSEFKTTEPMSYLISSFIISVVCRDQDLMYCSKVHSWTSLSHCWKRALWGWWSFLVLWNSKHYVRTNLKHVTLIINYNYSCLFPFI